MDPGTINSKGSIFVSGIGTLTNTGTITNSSTIVSNKAIDNTSGTINNTGVILTNDEITGSAPSGVGAYYKPDSTTGVINVTDNMKLLPQSSFLIKSDQHLVINDDKTFMISASSNLTNEGTLMNSGMFNNNQTIINNNTILSGSDLKNVVDGTSGTTSKYYKPDSTGEINITDDLTMPDATFTVHTGKSFKIKDGTKFTL